ncbi:MAG: hypothetical protein IPK27_05760 [Rhodanobacteraceae bacterium]|nr:hypothetical protein [Rhodanobacteraceae bacterium]
MAAVDLRFAHPPASAHLVLGGDPAGSHPPIDAQLVGTLPALRFEALAIPNASATLVATFPAMEMIAEARYASRAARPLVGSTGSAWQRGRGFEDGAEHRTTSTASHSSQARASRQTGQSHDANVTTRRAATLVRAPVSATARFHGAVQQSPGALRIAHSESLHLRTAGPVAYANAARMDAMERRVLHQDGLRDRRQPICSRFDMAQAYPGLRFFEVIQVATAMRRWMAARWQNAMRPPPGRPPVRPDDPDPPIVPCYTPNPTLRFAALAATNGHLLFVCENHPGPGQDGPVVVPIRRVYVVLNHVTLHRWPDGMPVPVISLSLSLDVDSWAWGFEATLPAIAEALIAPADGAPPVELVAHVNGTDFRVLAENLTRDRSFGEASLRLSGRGRTAALSGALRADDERSPIPQPRTARQLMDDVLTINGVPLGWTIDWGLTDWNVPAGVFAQQGTWIDALAAIAEAPGGYLLPHPSEAILRVRHRYPVAPWDWHAVTPDLVLPVDAVSRESLRWLEKPAYNRVFVSGQSAGVLGQVTRTGTAGNVIAPMVVDALITEAAAARQRGTAILADTGPQFEVGLRLPVLPETGIVEPGTFVEYQDGSVSRLGLVRSTRIEADFPEVWQTLGVECRA